MTDKKQQKDNHSQVGGVPTDKVSLVWDKVAPILKTVIKPETGMNLDCVYRELLTGNAQLWVVNDFEGVVVSHILYRPLDKVLRATWLAGSNMNAWLRDCEQMLEEFARHHECTAMIMQGRKGFRAYEKEFRDYKPAQTVYYKDLK